MFESDYVCSVSSPVVASTSPTLKTLEPLYTRASYLAALNKICDASGVGLGLSYNSREMGPLVPPPTPSLLSSQTSANALGNSIAFSVEEQVLNAMSTNKLYLRRHRVRKESPSVFPLPSPFSPLAARPKHSSTAHSSPTVFSFTPPPQNAIVMTNASEIEHLGARFLSLNIAPPEDGEFAADDLDNNRDDVESKYLKPGDFKSSKGRICTPNLALERTISWM
ncbi:hypothetical protein SCHPADRAFT_928678 [Schizopora paradoxa]|uniref:Uncharacterized protein n=1 Tax=Schizopora paradoxa TaxID=27342 RepID=A0A0H2RNW0_9AGAM|nr:hypothetical protein SCHPADRAFT_928678 [Schizopora paradoxa]